MQTETAQPTGRPHRNHGLFSDHYLGVTLPQHPDWRTLEGEAAGKMAEVARVLEAFKPSANEAQTEEDLLRPVLRLLGHEDTFEVQPALTTPEGTKRPDYVLYRDLASLAANKDRPLTEELLHGRAFAVGDTKFWERPLDVSLKGAGGSRNRDAFSRPTSREAQRASARCSSEGLKSSLVTVGREYRAAHRGQKHAAEAPNHRSAWKEKFVRALRLLRAALTATETPPAPSITRYGEAA